MMHFERANIEQVFLGHNQIVVFGLRVLVGNDHHKFVRVEYVRRVVHGQDQVVPRFVGHDSDEEFKIKTHTRRMFEIIDVNDVLPTRHVVDDDSVDLANNPRLLPKFEVTPISTIKLHVSPLWHSTTLWQSMPKCPTGTQLCQNIILMCVYIIIIQILKFEIYNIIPFDVLARL